MCHIRLVVLLNRISTSGTKSLFVTRYPSDIVALKLVPSAFLLDLGFSEARVLTYQLTDFMAPSLYSEYDNPLLVKNLTPV